MKNFIEDSAEQIMLNSMANVFMSEKLDPVGKEDSDIDNDGDSDKSDSYLRKRRQAVGAAIAAEKAKRVKKEELEMSLRQKVEGLNEKKLYPADKATTSDEKEITIEEKPVKNIIKINPDIQEGLKQARKNVGAGKCWDGYVARGTKKKGGKEVPNCQKEQIDASKTNQTPDQLLQGMIDQKKLGGKVVKMKEETLSEKAVSRKQQRFMGMVRAAQKGEGAASPEVAKVAASMKKKDVKDFASTKHDGLPEKKKVKEETEINEIAPALLARAVGGALLQKGVGRAIVGGVAKGAASGLVSGALSAATAPLQAVGGVGSAIGGLSKMAAANQEKENLKKKEELQKSVKEEIAAIAEGARKPEVEEKGKKVAELEREGRAKGITDKFRKEYPGSRQEKKERGRKQTEGELTQERIKKHNERVRKHGFTSKEKKESKAREKYDSARD